MVNLRGDAIPAAAIGRILFSVAQPRLR